jgi:DNA-binding CsgD family transcriptional regulator/tetratricopeptide (TPR) repeat protein
MLARTVDSQPRAGTIVGRETELAQLEQTLDDLERGSASCLAVEGEPGIGKTRLLAELRALAEARGHLVLSGAAAEFERELPFSVFVDALDAYVASQELREHKEWDADLERELGRVLPSLRSSDGAGAIADERYRAHRAVSFLLGLIAQERPLVLMLDDLHWSDGASIELIAALVRRPPAAPVLLAFSFRPGQAAERLVTTMAGAPLTRLELCRLSEAEAAELLGSDDARLVAGIYSHAGGNPFYLEQLGRAGDGAGLSRAAERKAEVAGVPVAVGAAIAGELESLSARTRAFVDAAAVAGEPFEPDLAAAIAELSEAEGLAALDDLLSVDLVRPTDVPRRFSFRHPLVRRSVYESTPGGWRLAAHGRAAEALSARGADAAEQAHHVELSAGHGDQGAIELLVEAGRATAARAPAAAARWFEAALRLLPSAEAERQVDLRVALASAQRSLGALERCRDTLLEATKRLPPESAIRRVELTALCAAVEHWQGRHEEAHHRLARAWRELPDRSTPEAAALQIELTVDGLYQNDFEQTFEMGEAALSTALALADRGLIAGAASALALGEAAGARVGSAREHRAEALEQLERMDDDELASRLETFYYLGWAENYLEHYDDAIARAERGMAIARSTGEGRLLVPLMLLRCYPLEMKGRLAEAGEICETAVEIARLSANPHYLFWALWELAWARYFAGDLDGTIAAGEESVHVGGGRMRGGTMPSAGGGAGWALALAQFELGEVDEARRLMWEVGGEEMENWFPAERYFNWENLALAELALGNDEAADSIARRAEESAGEVDLRLPTALAARTRAEVQLASGDPAGAGEAAEISIAAGEAIEAGLEVACSRSVLGRALAAAGDRPRAIEVLREAERELDECGCVRMRDEARRELRKLGARAEVRGPSAAGDSGIGTLTKREREISELITERMTNKEIATHLFLSEKTIESHIRNVFNKLGASSRVEVARAIERDRRAREASAEPA